MAGCNYGRIIDERRAGFDESAQFYDDQIKATTTAAKQLETENTYLSEQISSNNKVIQELSSTSTSLAQKKTRAQAVYSANAETLATYENLSLQTQQEIELQETLLAEIRDTAEDTSRAASLEKQIAALKEQNAQLADSVSTLTAQNDQIGGFL